MSRARFGSTPKPTTPVTTSNSPQPRPPGADEIITLLRQICRPLDAESIPLHLAQGRLLRQPVHAPEDQPAFDRSAFDGFAIRMDDPASHFRIVDELRAGDWRPRALLPGEAVRIATGAALPTAGLQVVMKEHTRSGGDQLEILERETLPNIRLRGADARKGQVLIESGTILTPGGLALLASIGHTNPLVSRLPRVLHVATGNELVPPDQAPMPGQIRDSNSTLVRAFLEQRFITPIHRRVPEDYESARAVLDEADAFDLILLSGGASVGEHDFTRRLLEQTGFQFHVKRTAMRPGKPLILAQKQGTLAVGLPGNPLAHFVCLNLFVRVALDCLAQHRAEPLFHHGTLASKLLSDANHRETFWPARAFLEQTKPRLIPLPWASSGDLTALARANSLIRVVSGAQQLELDAVVEFLLTDPLA
jgi:molybdopterin molybdotransferase